MKRQTTRQAARRRVLQARRQGGFAYIAAVVLLVVVGGVIAAMLRLTSAQQNTATDAALIARAGQAARGGVEWMMYQLGANPGTAPCTQTPVPPALQVAPASTNLGDFFAATGFRVTVTCSYTGFVEGVNAAGTGVTKNIYTISATACNGSLASCPDNAGAGAPDYTERRRVATICMVAGGGLC